MRISDWSSDVCSSDLPPRFAAPAPTSPRMTAPAVHDLSLPRRLPPPLGTPAGSQPQAPTAHAPSPSRGTTRSEEHTSELQSLLRNSYAVICLTKKIQCPTITML